jgi:hypothetical protein
MTIALLGTILDNAPADENCSLRFSGVLESLGSNLDSGTSCGLAGPADQSDLAARLEGLADNGGPTLTHALRSSSPAIDTFEASPCPGSDQRGAPRPAGARRAAGAAPAAW